MIGMDLVHFAPTGIAAFDTVARTKIKNESECGIPNFQVSNQRANLIPIAKYVTRNQKI